MTRRRAQDRPKKPSPSFPLSPHGSGQWVKKVAGKIRYFGQWSDPEAALAKYKREFPYLQLGLKPPTDSLTVATLLNSLDDAASVRLATGRIDQRTYCEYMGVGSRSPSS